MKSPENGHQFPWVNRLDEVKVKACLPGASSVFLLPVARYGNEQQGLLRPAALELPRYLVTIHPGKADVQHHHVRHVGPRCGKCFRSVPGNLYSMSGQAQQLRQGLRGVRVVLNDENA